MLHNYKNKIYVKKKNSISSRKLACSRIGSSVSETPPRTTEIFCILGFFGVVITMHPASLRSAHAKSAWGKVILFRFLLTNTGLSMSECQISTSGDVKCQISKCQILTFDDISFEFILFLLILFSKQIKKCQNVKIEHLMMSNIKCRNVKEGHLMTFHTNLPFFLLF